MELKQELKKVLNELRKEKERKFDQTLDLIVNLKNFDTKKNPVNLVVSVPHKIKEKKIAGFLESKNKNIETIITTDFKKYSDKKQLKKLIKQFDFFLSQASLMPKVATTFGRVLGPAGKMPSPQLGVLFEVNDKAINELKEKINSSVKIKIKEASVKLAVGKQSMNNENLIENILTIYKAILKVLPKREENIKNIELKFTMTKPQKIFLK